MKAILYKLARRAAPVAAILTFVAAIGGRWHTAAAAPAALTPPAQTMVAPAEPEPRAGKKSSHKELVGKLNLNTATEDQLMLLPSVGPAKAERIVTWRKKNGVFRRPADLRHVKGFGYKTFKKLEPYLDVKGDNTLEAK